MVKLIVIDLTSLEVTSPVPSIVQVKSSELFRQCEDSNPVLCGHNDSSISVLPRKFYIPVVWQLEVDGHFGAINVHLSPRQVHLLIEIVKGLSMPGKDDWFNSLLIWLVTILLHCMDCMEWRSVEQFFCNSHFSGFPPQHGGHIWYYGKAQHVHSLNLLVEFLHDVNFSQ